VAAEDLVVGFCVVGDVITFGEVEDGLGGFGEEPLGEM